MFKCLCFIVTFSLQIHEMFYEDMATFNEQYRNTPRPLVFNISLRNFTPETKKLLFLAGITHQLHLLRQHCIANWFSRTRTRFMQGIICSDPGDIPDAQSKVWLRAGGHRMHRHREMRAVFIRRLRRTTVLRFHSSNQSGPLLGGSLDHRRAYPWVETGPAKLMSPVAPF